MFSTLISPGRRTILIKAISAVVAAGLITSIAYTGDLNGVSVRKDDYNLEDSSLFQLLDNNMGAGSDEDDLDEFILQTMTINHIPGLAAAIFKNEQIVWSGFYGFANFEGNIPVSDTTSFMLASLSKTFTGTALMKLWEDGWFELDDYINDYLPFSVYNPNYPGHEITFRQLMTHTSSLKDNWSVMYYYEGDSPIPLGEYCEEYFTPGGDFYDASANFFSWAPGQGWSYCNNGIVLVGYLVKAITGIEFDQYCRDSIFAPLGLTHTSWFLEGMDTSNVAMPYSYSNGEYVPYGLFGYSDYPAGQLRTSTLDLARHLMVYLNHGVYGDVRILDSVTVAEILTPQVPHLSSNQGLIWFHHYDGSHWHWRHGGGDFGVRTQGSICPEANYGLIVLTNGESSAGVNAVLGMLYEYATQDIVLSGSIISDDAGGDGDGIAEGGETVQLVCTFANFFADAISNVQVYLSIDDPSINVTNNFAGLGDIPPDDSVANTDQPFEFVIPEGYIPRINDFYFEVIWNNGIARDTLMMSEAIGRTTILLVDDDNNGYLETYYMECFQRARVPYDIQAFSPSPAPEDIIGYDIVVWFTGDYRSDPLDTDEINSMRQYMDAGGRLFLSGQGIAAQLNNLDSTFLCDHLKSGYLSSSLIPVLRAASAGQVFDIADTIAIYGSGGAVNQTLPDQIVSVNGGVGEMCYLGGTDLGAVSFSGSYRLVFLAFGFEAIVNGDPRWTERDQILLEILDFFDYQLPRIQLTLGISPGDPTHMVDHSPVISWDCGDCPSAQEMYHIQMGIDTDWSLPEMWDYGPISGQETEVIYGGLELIDGEAYFFRVRTNDGTIWSNWHYGQLRMNSRPTVPAGLSPDNMQEIEMTPPSLSHTNAQDSEGDILTYAYELYDDSLLSSLAAHALEVPQGSGGTTVWEVPSALPDGEDYFWRVRAGDGYEYGDWSGLASFYIIPFYVCGDASGDDIIDAGDAVYIINYVFKSGPAPEIPEAGDANADGRCNVGDAVYLINYIFREGAEPQCP